MKHLIKTESNKNLRKINPEGNLLNKPIQKDHFFQNFRNQGTMNIKTLQQDP